MKAAKKRTQKRAWSAHSQRTRLKILELGAELKKTLDRVVFLEGQRDKAREISKSQTGTALRSAAIGRALSDTLEKIDDYERQIKAFQERAATLREEIHSLENPPAPASLRRQKLQDDVHRMVSMRAEIDGRLEGILATFKIMLHSRAALTEKITEAAATLEIAPELDLDATRFAELLFSLPVEIAETSGKWLENFLYRQKGKQAHTIGEKPFIVPETLAHHGVFLPGEQALLTEAQAALLVASGPEKALPTPMEMELAAGNREAPPLASPSRDESGKLENFPVSGLPERL